MINYFLGEVVTKFYKGEKYQFEYVGGGEFKQITGDVPPSFVRDNLYSGVFTDE